MKRPLTLLLVLSLFLSPMASAGAADPESDFVIRSGSRSEPRVAITVDDAFDLSYVWKIRDLLHDFGVVGTFFPIGVKLFEADRAEWRKVLEYGNEIGSHNIGHYRMGASTYWDIMSALGRFQERLDQTLGFPYPVQCFRPPYGNATDENGHSDRFRDAVRDFGYAHIILWDVSQTDAEKALRQVQNGSILLFHSRLKDYNCLRKLIPALLAQGYELVTVSGLLGFGENETGDTLYVYDRKNYENRE